MESEKGTEVVLNKDLNTHIEATKNGSSGGGDPLSKSLSSSSSSSSSYSASSSSNRLRQLDLGEKDGGDNPEWSMVSASPRSGTGPSQRLPPPIQTMGQPEDYDPNRIPSSVFSTQNNAAMDWSVASNDSLFSIHIGNNSFSREQMLLLKSGELTMSSSANDLNNVPTPQSLPTVDEEANCDTPKLGPAKKDSLKKDSESGENLKKPEKVVVKNETPPRTFASPPRLSEDSNKSFAFPVLANEGSSMRPIQETSHTTAQVKAKSKPSPKHEPEPNPEPSHHHHQTPAQTPPRRKKWFPCFSCCC